MLSKRMCVVVLVTSVYAALVLARSEAADAVAGTDPAITVQAVAPATGKLSVQTTIDKKFVSKVYALKKAKPAEIEPIIAKAISPEGGLTKTMTVDGSELLVVSVPTYMLAGVDASVASLDVPNAAFANDGQDSCYYRPKHRLPSELVPLVQTTAGSPAGYLVTDDANNTIYFQDAPNSVKLYMTALAEFDRPQVQAEIEVRIVEVDDSNSERIGLLWDAWKRALPESANASFTREHTRSDADGTSRTRSCTVDLSTMSPQALADFVNYMTREGAAQVKTTTRLNCVQQKTVTLDAGDVHRFLTGAQPVASGPAKNLVESVLSGLSVKLTPFIGTESIKLQMDASVSSFSGFDPNGLPVVNSRTVSATAVLRNGETFAITGLERQIAIKEKDRVFLLGYIPLLGDWLFTTHTTATQKTQMVVFITPKLPAVAKAPAADQAKPGTPESAPKPVTPEPAGDKTKK